MSLFHTLITAERFEIRPRGIEIKTLEILLFPKENNFKYSTCQNEDINGNSKCKFIVEFLTWLTFTLLSRPNGFRYDQGAWREKRWKYYFLIKMFILNTLRSQMNMLKAIENGNLLLNLSDFKYPTPYFWGSKCIIWSGKKWWYLPKKQKKKK